MAKLISAILARNEAGDDRYLRRVLARCAEFSDAILVLDDNSTDATPEIARDFGCIVETRSGDGFWQGSEAPARRELWERAAQFASDGWVLIADADMLLQGDPRPLTLSWEAASWAFPLADCWDSEDTFRVDGPWQFGATHPRPWLFKPSFAGPQFAPEWSTNAVHAGHAPANWPQAGPTFIAPPELFWKHLAYVKPEHRKAKHAAYTSRTDLSEFEMLHAMSIAD